MRECPSCKGTGEGPKGAYSPRVPVCLDCDGSGEVEDTEICEDKEKETK